MASHSVSAKCLPTEKPEIRISCSTLKSSSSSTQTPETNNTCVCNISPELLGKPFNITLNLLSPSASSGPFCRICHEGDYHEDLVSLCKCSGSVGLVHLRCMERWLSTRRDVKDKCEICNYSFETVRSPKSLGEWFRSDQGCMGTGHIMGDISCFSLITPLTVLSTFLCFEGARRQVTWNNSFEAGVLMALGTFLITTYVVWNVLTIRYYLRSYVNWRSINQNVKLVRVRRKSADIKQNSNPSQQTPVHRLNNSRADNSTPVTESTVVGNNS